MGDAENPGQGNKSITQFHVVESDCKNLFFWLIGLVLENSSLAFLCWALLFKN